jgi:hypothetical protein
MTGRGTRGGCFRVPVTGKRRKNPVKLLPSAIGAFQQGPPFIHLLNLFKNLVAFPATILIDWHLSPLSLRTPVSSPQGALCAPRLKTLVSKLKTRPPFMSGRRGHNLVTGVRDRLCNPVRRFHTFFIITHSPPSVMTSTFPLI